MSGSVELDFDEAATLKITFFAEGLPKGQPRVKAFARRKGAKFVGGVYDPGTADGWKHAVVVAGRAHSLKQLEEGPLRVDLHFVFPRPQTHFSKSKKRGVSLRSDAAGFHTNTPDKDNLEKAVYDAITAAALFWKDDKQIAAGFETKVYGDRPGCLITITKL